MTQEEPAFTCARCRAMFAALPHWREVPEGPLRFRCRSCVCDVESVAWFRRERLTCPRCRRRVKMWDAWMCDGCYEVGACEECARYVAETHTCASESLIGSLDDEAEAGDGVGAKKKATSARATMMRPHPMTPAKARVILHEGVARGKKISEKQRRYFGHITSYGKRKGTREHLTKAAASRRRKAR